MLRVTPVRTVVCAAAIVMLLHPLTPSGRAAAQGFALGDQINAAPMDGSPIMGRRGYDQSTPMRRYMTDGSRITVLGEETDLFQLSLRTSTVDFYQGVATRGDYTGYLRAGSAIYPLPVGSSLNADTGVFTWQPGPGFLGNFDLVFVRWAGSHALARQELRVVLNPQGSNRVGPQVVIDTPAPSANVTGAFVVAGWAVDLDADQGTGVDVLHVWAYPTTGGAPVFLGVTAYGGKRPDVGAIFGDQFTASGYSLTVDTLLPGSYDVAVFAWSTAAWGFVPAKVVRVNVR